MDATIDLTLERHRDLLKRGTVLVDETDPGTSPRVLFYLEHAIQDASPRGEGDRRVISKQMLFVELDAGRHHAPPALRALPRLPTAARRRAGARQTILARPSAPGSPRELEQPGHRARHRPTSCPSTSRRSATARSALIDKTEAAVKDRLTKEINYWDHRAETAQGSGAGRQGQRPAQLGKSPKARRRPPGAAQKRLDELELERQISPLPPVVLGGVLVVPAGLIAAMTGATAPASPGRRHAGSGRPRPRDRHGSERSLGFEPIDREFEKLGYDIESRDPGTGRLRFIEVKGRVAGADTITVTRNEILYSLNKPDDFILAIVEFLDDGDHRRPLPPPPVPRQRRQHRLRRRQRQLPLCGPARPSRSTRHEPRPRQRTTQAKKLIEVALPLDAINKASAREKSIRHGHPSTLHLWWARRPLAAARAVIFAQMVDDPRRTPDLLPDREEPQEKERQRLFKIIEDLVLWENTTNETVLQAARDEIWAELAPHLRGERRPPAGEGAVRPRRSCPPSTTPSPAAARCRWRRSGSGWRATPAT